jgi:hypothetical protein
VQRKEGLLTGSYSIVALGHSMEWSRMQPYADKAFELTCS